ncbi:MAG TPA: ATP-binding cassette domain-containing protein, partial [Terriglobales bacterium]|nr:ATP-binding cassette domain-containing protein [Terriglobales bacterium]
MATEPAIQITSLGHRYGDRIAVDSISFDVHTGEIFGLLGPNGSGKTTLFRILSTLMVPTSGGAHIAGFDPVGQPNQVRRRIGVVGQAQSVDVKLTARENLMRQGHLYGLSGVQL